jgi:Transposase DDE domain
MNISDNAVSIKKKPSKPTQVQIQERVSDTIHAIRQAFCRKKVDEIAWETGFIKRASYKVGGKDFLVTMLLASLDSSHTSLEKISALLTRVNRNNRITAQSIMERINNPATADFFLKIQEMVLKSRILDWTKSVPPSLFSHFSKVLIQDSTVFELHEDLQEHFKGSGGRSSKSCVKIDVVYDLLSKQYEKFTLTDQRETDSLLALKIEDVLKENSLLIRDLGYLRIDGLEKVVQKKAFYLSRLKTNFQIYMDPDSDTPIDLADCFKDDENLIDLPIYITKDRLQTRLIAYRAPQEVIDKRKRLAHATAKKQGRTLTKKALKMLEYTVFITNVPPEYWVPEVVGTIYAIRWQLELLFKNWKTGLGIHYLKGINPNRVRSLIYARLILVIVINKMYRLASSLSLAVGKTVSMHKVFAWMRDPERLLKILNGSLGAWEKKFYLDTVLKSMCQQKRKRKTTFECVCENVFYDKYYGLA